MTARDAAIRMGAAAFAVGVALAGPQAAGLAGADGAPDGTTASSAAESPDATGISAPAGDVDVAPATAAVPDGIDGPNPAGEPASDQTPADEPEPTDIDDVVAEADPAPAAESEPDEPPVGGPRTEFGSDENGTHPGALGEPESLPDAPSAISPGRVGPDPLPRWRTAAVPAAAGAVSPPEPAPSSEIQWLSGTDSAQAPGPADQPASGRAAVEPVDLFAGVPVLRAGIAQFIDTVIAWLDGLPANPFTPLTEFISGALLLVRRALVPEYSVCAAAAGSPATSDCSGGIRWEVPEFQDQYGTTRSSQHFATQLGDYPTTYGFGPWYQVQTEALSTLGAKLLRATKDTPMENGGQDGHNNNDGVKGMIKNFSKQVVLVEMGRGDDGPHRAVLFPGDELPYTMSAKDDDGRGGVVSFYALDRNGLSYVGPVRLKIVDPMASRPDTAFAPANSDYVNTRESWNEGDAHHEIWGGTAIWVKREEDGWTIPYSQAWYAYKLEGHSSVPDEQLINSSAQSDWAVFTIHIDGL